MYTEEDTFERLLRTKFEIVAEEIYVADPYGSYTFSRMNADNEWRVSPSFHYIVLKHNWTIEDFNIEVGRRYDE